MKILITGVAGFIGFHTAKQLLDRGDEVIGIDNFNPQYDPKLKEARAAQLENHKGFTLIRGDITDRERISKAMNGVERILHLAAMAGVRYSFEHPDEFILNNIQGFFEMIDEAKKAVWYHTIQLTPDFTTDGMYNWRPYWNKFDFGDLQGKKST